MNTCDHGHQTRQEVRLLPISDNGNAIVCRRHYQAEMAHRRQRLADGVPFDLPKWTDLKIYETPKRSEQLELFDTLENLVDRNSLTSVLETLATICAQKANKYGDWQYGGLSAAWQDMYERLEQARAASTTSKNNVT